MSKSSKSPNHEVDLRALLEHPLELPDGRAFTSTTGKLGVKEMTALSEAYLPCINSQPDFEAKKRSKTFDEPFVL